MAVPWSKSQGKSWRAVSVTMRSRSASWNGSRVRTSSRLAYRFRDPHLIGAASRDPVLELGDDGRGVVAGRDDRQVGDPRLLEGGEPPLDVRRGPDQVAGLDPLRRDQRLGL